MYSGLCNPRHTFLSVRGTLWISIHSYIWRDSILSLLGVYNGDIPVHSSSLHMECSQNSMGGRTKHSQYTYLQSWHISLVTTVSFLQFIDQAGLYKTVNSTLKYSLFIDSLIQMYVYGTIEIISTQKWGLVVLTHCWGYTQIYIVVNGYTTGWHFRGSTWSLHYCGGLGWGWGGEVTCRHHRIVVMQHCAHF